VEELAPHAIWAELIHFAHAAVNRKFVVCHPHISLYLKISAGRSIFGEVGEKQEKSGKRLTVRLYIIGGDRIKLSSRQSRDEFMKNREIEIRGSLNDKVI
jgi:hypothetical protein